MLMFFYDILYIFFFLCYFPLFLIRGKCHRGFLMRLGFFGPGVIAKLRGRNVIWLHTVSVGEAQAAGTLIRILKQQYPQFALVISTVTQTGNRVAQKLIGPQDLAIYFPLDISWVLKRVIDLVNPRLVIIAETEIWPNFIINLNKRNIPIILINGRVSSGSFKGYRIIRPILRKSLQKINLFCMQTENDANRIISLGADETKVKVTGNMKFDIQLSAISYQLSVLGLTKEDRLFIAGSTHRGEEKIVLQVYKELIRKHPRLRLLIAPRHIERTKEIERLIAELGFKSQRVSQLVVSEQPATDNSQRILILDSIGQLKGLYALAEIVFIGGSLIPHGGQNPIEPAVFFKPILFGPYMSNFSNIADVFLKNHAAMMVKDARNLQESCFRLLCDSGLRKQLGERAKEVVEVNRGAAFKNMELIKGIFLTN